MSCMVNFNIKYLPGYLYVKPMADLYRMVLKLIRSSYYQRKLRTGKHFRAEAPVYMKGYSYISIGNYFRAREGLILNAWDNYEGVKFTPQIKIGNYVDIGFDCHITAVNSITIGNHVLMGSKIYITDHFHGAVSAEEKDIPPAQRKLFSKGPVFIGDNVWIGDNVIIMPSVTIGKGAVIGANAVVTKDIPDYGVAAGVPAKLLKVIE